MSFSKRRGNDAVCYTKPLDSLKSWNDHFFWVDAFACPASFLWNTSKSMLKDPFPKSSEFNVEHYATLVAYPAPFHKYPDPFLCLIGISRKYTLDEDTYSQFMPENGKEIDLLSFILTFDPTKVRVGERQRAEDEPKLLDTTVGRGSGNLTEQGDSASGRHGVGIPLVSEAAETVVEDVAPVQPRRQRKRKTFVLDAGGPSHPPKTLREDHGTLSVTSVGGKSRSAVQRLLARAVQNAEVRGEPIPTLPFVTSSVSATLEHEDEVYTDSATGLHLQTIGAPQRFVISSDSSHHSSANIEEAEVDSFARPSVPLMTVATTVTSTVDPATIVKENFVESSVFGGDSYGGGADHTVGGFSDLTGSDFIVGGAARQMSLSPEVRMRAEYNIRERRRLNSVVEEKNSLLKARDVEIETLKAQLLVKEAEAAEAIRLRTEASKFEVVEKSLRDEVNVLKEQNAALEQESTNLGVKVADLTASVKVREQEVADLDAQVAFAKSQSDNLAGRVHELETSSAGLQEKVTAYENCMGKLEEFQDEQIRVMNDKFEKLYVDFVEMALHLEEKFYPHLLTTIAGHRWLLTYGVKLAIVKCLHLPEYLSALGVAISRAIKKGMQDGLAARITHGQEGRVLTDISAFNPSAKSNYISALKELQDVNFSLLSELKSNKDASIETLMNILRLDEPLAERLGLDESQPRVDQLSALHDVFVPLVEPLSSAPLKGTKGTSGIAPETTMTLSVTFASTSSIPPISTDDYDVVHADGQEGRGADANPFPNVDDTELNID
ncbi:hypothetical protein Tco_1015692 [Tanacetum coccineum]|uniref:Transposase (Putative), gypsy type n=1 Tax=Tanacetum coccineum TaxID=301880 RepID=A0ABQ5FND7_9ASTR